MKIVVLAWGSLVWDQRGLQIVGGWLEDGPVLPIEFSRISKDDRLTLVVDEISGANVTTYYARSAMPDLSAAIENLQKREGMPTNRGVGFVEFSQHREAPRASPHSAKIRDEIVQWANGKGFDAVIWTALSSNFEQRRKEPFSVESALNYVDSLTDEKRANALKYFCNTPIQVETPVRRAVRNRFPDKA